ncbi:MAG: hypothetical protein KTR28_06500 [Micavibrio sp.]|nr:hypothetical protein [Micavibrio sp.]
MFTDGIGGYVPTEERFITFSLDEIYKALFIKCEKDDLKLPPRGKLQSIIMDENTKQTPEQILELTVLSEDTGATETIKFARMFFAHSLVFYCQGCGIPIPKLGTKILGVMEDKIVMKITLETTPD